MKGITAIILAGGFGTRLRSEIADLPKPLAPVNGKPFLDHVLMQLIDAGFEKCILSVGYLHEKIIKQYGDSFRGLGIKYSTEHDPLGTGGGIRLAMSESEEQMCLVLNGDTLFRIGLDKLIAAHSLHQAAATLALRHVEDASRYGTVLTDHENRITAFTEKSAHHGSNLINGGIYVLDRKSFLANTPAGKAFSIEQEYFAKLVSHEKFIGLRFDAYFIDIGIPADYKKAQHELK